MDNHYTFVGLGDDNSVKFVTVVSHRECGGCLYDAARDLGARTRLMRLNLSSLTALSGETRVLATFSVDSTGAVSEL